MSGPPADPRGVTAGESDLSRKYVLAIVMEVLVLLGLYGLGRYFG